MTRVRVTIIAAEKQYVLNIKRVCLLSCLIYQACSARASYCIVIFGLPGCIVFFALSHKRHEFRKIFRKKNLFFIYSKFCVKHFELYEEFIEILS